MTDDIMSDYRRQWFQNAMKNLQDKKPQAKIEQRTSWSVYSCTPSFMKHGYIIYNSFQIKYYIRQKKGVTPEYHYRPIGNTEQDMFNAVELAFNDLEKMPKLM